MSNLTTYTESDGCDMVAAIITSEPKTPSDEVRGDASITDDLGADPLKAAETTYVIENRFRVRLQEVAAHRPFTVDAIVDKLMAELV